MEAKQITREWLEALDPVEFLLIDSMISDIKRQREEDRRREMERRHAGIRKGSNGRYLELERVKCGKRGCKKCSEGEMHGPYWYLYRPKKDGAGRTSEYVGKVLPEKLAKEFSIPEEERAAD